MRREPRYHDRHKAQCTPGGVLALHLEHGVAPHGGEDVHRVVAIDAGIPKRDHSQLPSYSLCPHPLRGGQSVEAVPQSLRLCVPERGVVLFARPRQDENLERDVHVVARSEAQEPRGRAWLELGLELGLGLGYC